MRHCNTRMTSEMNLEHDSYLLSASLARALPMIESNACGSQAILRETFGGGECNCLSIRPNDVVSVNGGEPVINSKAVHANATVTICHSRSRDLKALTSQADILVAAIGRAGFITPEMVRPGATIIDVGINRITERAEFERYFAGNEKREATFLKRGSTIVGDVDPRAFEQAGAYTPVPGGVGPLTIAMLMANTVRAAKMRRGL